MGGVLAVADDPMTNEPLAVVDQEEFLGDGAALPETWPSATDTSGQPLRTRRDEVFEVRAGRDPASRHEDP
jgi:hypothetical protein